MRIAERLLHPFRPARNAATLIRSHLDEATSHADLDGCEREIGSLQRALRRTGR